MGAAAEAGTHVLARAGAWEAFGGTTNSGRGVCGISASPSGQYFGLKQFAGDPTFTIQLGKASWRIEDGAKQKLTMRFDSKRIWHATGTGFHFNDGDGGLEFTINRAELDNFLREFLDSGVLRIAFEQSNASPWSISLAGTSALYVPLQRCLRGLPGAK
ncbi:MAG: hypothetical protein KIT16_16775 [Rhodospirillaceae bacterium]|nr:hypothetical protein [Rhodospirillaceae bacterium]